MGKSFFRCRGARRSQSADRKCRGAHVGNVSKLAFIKNMKRLLHEIMQWSLFSYIKIPPRLRFLGFRCGKAASAS